MLVSSQKDPKVIAYTTYYTEPVKKYFGELDTLMMSIVFYVKDSKIIREPLVNDANVICNL